MRSEFTGNEQSDRRTNGRWCDERVPPPSTEVTWTLIVCFLLGTQSQRARALARARAYD